jgi:hypothetical protein
MRQADRSFSPSCGVWPSDGTENGIAKDLPHPESGIRTIPKSVYSFITAQGCFELDINQVFVKLEIWSKGTPCQFLDITGKLNKYRNL